MPLVSRYFREVCRDPCLLPTELRIFDRDFWSEARWRSFLRWLAARASALRTFQYGLEVPEGDNLRDYEDVRESLSLFAHVLTLPVFDDLSCRAHR